MVVIGTNGQAFDDGYDLTPGWTGFRSIGKPASASFTGDPSVVAWGANRLDVFGRGSDNNLWHTWFDGSWHAWENLGAPTGGLTSSPDASSWGSGHLDIYARDTAGHMRRKTYDYASGGWVAAWQDLGAPAVGLSTTSPGAASWTYDRADVYARGGDGALWHKWSNDGGATWYGWENLGGVLQVGSGPDVSTWGNGRYDVFYRGTNDHLMHLWYNWQPSSWSTPEDLAGVLTSDPTAASWGPDRIDVFARGSDTAMWQTYHVPHPPTVSTPATVPALPCRTGTSRPYMSTKQPNLQATVGDADADPVQGSFEVWVTNGSEIGSPALSAKATAGTPTTWTVPSGDFLEAGTYSWRARGYDGTSYTGYTPWCEFTIDTVAPAAASVASVQYPVNTWKTAGGAGTFTFSDTSTDVDHYLYGVDGASPTTTATGSSLAWTPGDGWHTLNVQAVDRAGNTSPVTSYTFGATPAVSSPHDGDVSTGLITLTAQTAPGQSAVTFYYRRAPADPFVPIPAADVTNAGTGIQTWPVSFTSSGNSTTSPALVWNAAATLHDVTGPVELRTCFGSTATCGGDGSAGPHNTNPPTVTLDENQMNNAPTQPVGVGDVNLFSGDLAVNATDVSVSAYGSDLTVSRTFHSRQPATTGPLGPGWALSLPVDAANMNWTGLADTGSTVNVTDADGSTTSFARNANGGYTPTGDDATSGLTLVAGTADANGPTSFSLTDLDANTTTFTPTTTRTAPPTLTAPNSYSVSTVTQPGNSQTTTYTYSGGHVSRVLAPVPTGAICTTPGVAATWTPGCRALDLTYDGAGHLTAVTYDTTDTAPATPAPVRVDVACYSYDSNGRLASAWDPRNIASPNGTAPHVITCDPANPVRPVTYTYITSGTDTGRLSTITPAGVAGYTLSYTGTTGRLVTATRSHAGGGGETTSIQYNVALSLGTDPVEDRPNMAGTVGTWGQTDVPVTATAVFGPGHTASTTDLRGADVTYLDANERGVNTASYGGSGAAGWHITTTEYDSTGNPIRTLSASNREEALNPTGTAGASLGLPADPATAARWLDTTNIYSSDGTDLLDTYGPYHQVALSDGSSQRARAHTHFTYDTGGEAGHPTGGPLHLVTSQYTAASLSPAATATSETDRRETDTAYALGTDSTGWTFRQPMLTTTDPGGLNIVNVTRYDANTGLVIETRMPRDQASTTPGQTAGTTDTLYYTAGTNSADANCGNKPAWINLVCKTLPAANARVAGSMPSLVTTWISSYDYLNRPLVTQETVVDSAGTTQTRTTTTGYGFNSTTNGYATTTRSTSVTGGVGGAVPATTISYDTSTGLPITTAAAATVTQAATSSATSYDDFGRVHTYTDASEATGAQANTTTTTYDSTSGLVTQVSDAHTTTTYAYNANGETRDMTTGMTVNVNSTTPYAGTFTASYNADGQLASETDPNGVTTAVQRDETGATLASTATQGGVAWASDLATPSIYGQWTTETNAAGAHTYRYDNAGRLTQATDAPVGAACTTNTYAYDLDSNRSSSTSYPDDGSGGCQTSTGGTPVSHTYDTADRLTDSGISYDAYGRITALPATAASGGAMTLQYFADDRASLETQGSTGKGWTLDADSRLRLATTTVNGSTTVSATNHYDDASGDSPQWIAENSSGSQWTANITGPDGNLAVTVPDTGTATYTYNDLHGDIIATAAAGAGQPTVTTDDDEFGTPVNTASVPRYNWLGGKQRAADDLGSLVLMGVRLYNPTLGRFLQTDPIPGGSANDYDYADQNPIGGFDLDGRRCIHGFGWACHAYSGAKHLLSRRPDYVSFSGSFFSPFLIGVGGSLTITRSGHLYGGLDAGIGVPGPGFAVRRGYIRGNHRGSDVDKFVGGWSGYASVTPPPFSFGATWGRPGHRHASWGGEVGVGTTPGASVTGGYSWRFF